MFTLIGSGCALIFGGYLSAHHGGWRTPFMVFALPGIILGIVAFFMQDYPNIQTAAPVRKKSGFVKNTITLITIPTLR